MKKLSQLGSVAVALLGFERLAIFAEAQCAMCQSALVNSAEGQRLAAGFNNGILFLLAFPVVILGGVLLLVWRASRIDARQLAKSQAEALEESTQLGHTPHPGAGISHGKLAEPA